MTYRERKERRADRLDEWAAGNEQKGDAAYQASHDATAGIPFGQPILVGHHSEKRHRKAIQRAQDQASKSVELSRKADDQRSRAENVRRQLDTSIYDDDPDAIERLTEKLAALEQRREQVKSTRARIRKERRAELKGLTAWGREEVMRAAGAPQYEIANLGGRISQVRDRLARLKRERDHGPRDRTITARFDSECADCNAPLSKGSLIRHNRQQGARCYPACAAAEETS